MAICKILVHYPNSSNWGVGDVVDITEPTQLIKEGKVELHIPEKAKETVVVTKVAPAKIIIQKQKKETIKRF